jgi:hypothetical protein
VLFRKIKIKIKIKIKKPEQEARVVWLVRILGSHKRSGFKSHQRNLSSLIQKFKTDPT